jgi:hypothetical protein
MKFRFWKLIAAVAVLALIFRRWFMATTKEEMPQTPLEKAGKWIGEFVVLSQILSRMPLRK